MCFFFFLNSLMKCFIFPQKFCVVYLVIKWRHKTYIEFIFKLLKIKKKFGKQREFTIKIKDIKYNCSSSSSMYILLNTYFYKNPDFYFDGLLWIPLHFCV